MAQGYHAGNERDRQQRVQHRVQRAPKTEVIPADFPEFTDFVTQESKGKDVEETFNDVEVTARIDSIDGCSIKCNVDDREEYLKAILIQRHPHSIWIEVTPI